MVSLLCKSLSSIENAFSNELTILDPCCGNKVIGDGLRDTFPNIIEIDKFAEGCDNIDFMDYEPDRKTSYSEGEHR